MEFVDWYLITWKDNREFLIVQFFGGKLQMGATNL